MNHSGPNEGTVVTVRKKYAEKRSVRCEIRRARRGFHVIIVQEDDLIRCMDVQRKIYPHKTT